MKIRIQSFSTDFEYQTPNFYSAGFRKLDKMLTKEITYQNLVEHTLLKVPEIQEEYDQFVVWYGGPVSKELEEIAKKHNILQTSGPIGNHIVFEDIFVKFVVSIVNQKPMERRLFEIMEFVEELATHPDSHIQNVIAVSFCEPLATTHRNHSNAILPYMGKQTACFFQEMADYFSGKGD